MLVSLLLFLLIPAYFNASAARNASTTPETAIIVTHSSDSASQLRFTLTTPHFSLDEAGNLSAAGLETTLAEPGAPALPYYTTLIALPPGGGATVSVTLAQTQQHELATPIAPAAEVADVAGLERALERLEVTRLESYGLTQRPDAALYHLNALYPAEAYTLSEPMMWRDVRVARLTLYPLRYNPAQNILQHSQTIHVSIQFDPGQPAAALPPMPTASGAFNAALERLVLNASQAQAWRSRPASLSATETTFPLGVETFKIAVDQTGLYEIRYADLIAAGLNPSGVNPHHFALSYRGEPVAYQLIGDSDNTFEAGEALRFYGWAFTGSRLEAQYITDNIYWLWVDAAGARTVNTDANTGGPTNITTFRSTVTADPDVLYFATFTDNWATAPNEPDAWYWARMEKLHAGDPPLIQSVVVTLPHPVMNSDTALITVEVLGRSETVEHDIRVDMNGVTGVAALQFLGKANANAEGTTSQTNLLAGANTFDVVLQSDVADYIYLNRISVEYTRHLVADDDQLIFDHNGSGGRNLLVSGFSQNDPNAILVWDITNPYQPSRIPLTAGDVSGTGPYQYRIGTTANGSAAFIATTTDNLLTPVSITEYVGASLAPAGDGADWLAIAHADFLEGATELAAYRQARDGLSTHVVDVADIIAQYGYGLWLPSAIQAYLTHAMADWERPPSYVVLAGDSTINPRQLPGDNEPWGIEEQFVPTALEFIDRVQGQIPTDHPYAMLVGEDELPDVAVGRLPVQTPEQLDQMLAKIEQYETALDDNLDWMQEILFVADNPDGGGDFCAENIITAGEHIPDNYTLTHECLAADQSNLSTLRADLFAHVNNGVAILNYRGHGSIQVWANIMSVDDTGAWFNDGRPTFILSADCLDGHFAWPTYPALSETYFGLAGAGSAGHWSSSGLGYSWEHSILHRAFYDGLFQEQLQTAGDAAVYAKLVYFAAGAHHSEGYSFTLQGDPAMHMTPPSSFPTFLPTLMKP